MKQKKTTRSKNKLNIYFGDSENKIKQNTEVNLGMAAMLVAITAAINNNQNKKKLGKIFKYISDITLEGEWIKIYFTSNIPFGHDRKISNWLNNGGYFYIDKNYRWSAEAFKTKNYIALGKYSSRKKVWSSASTKIYHKLRFR